ncbi:MAG: hypothetical protein ABSE72_13075 [Bacteroidales bacterium]|jgi:hypothetical protein
MDKLEKFITENRESFDDAEPLAGHFSRFEEKLDQQKDHSGIAIDKNFFLKIAAGLLILLTVSVYIFDFAANRISKNLSGEQRSALAPGEIQDAINYYDDAVSSKLGQINKLACCGQDTRKIYSMASDEIKTLNANSAELQKTLSENPGNERIQAAIIQNQQMKEKVINQVVGKLKIKN